MVQNLKYKLIEWKVSRISKRWGLKNPKILIAVNRNFNEDSWLRNIENEGIFEKASWVFGKNRFDIIQHLPEADSAFLFGLSQFSLRKEFKNKYIYFPMMGLDFLNHYNLDESITIDGPGVIATQAMAEYCLAMILMFNRGFHQALWNQKVKKWDQSEMIGFRFRSLKEWTIGVLGVGRVGKAVASVFHQNGCKVLGCDVHNGDAGPDIAHVYKATDRKDFLEAIDVLVITLPLNDSTRKTISSEDFSILGPEKYLINISRGEIIDEDDLIDALQKKIIKGAVLDVFAVEPLPKTHRLFRCPNLIITPHIAGNIALFTQRIEQDFLIKIRKEFEL